MKTIPISELCYTNVDFEIEDIFPVKWGRRKDFNLYSNKSRPCSALFFVCSDIEVSFFGEGLTHVIARHGDIVFIPKGVCYKVSVAGNVGKQIDTYTINFRLFDMNKEDILLFDRINILTNRPDNMLNVRLKNLFDTFYRIENADRERMQNLVKIKGEFFLLLNLIAESTSQCQDFYYPIRRGVEAFCREWNLNERIEKYAQICGMSETYFYRCFKNWSGYTPIEYRNSLRLANAESMLRCTDIKVKEISETVGFEDPFYFCRIFSQKFGASPQKYRKYIKNQNS